MVTWETFFIDFLLRQLLRLLAILSEKVNTKELFSSGRVSKNEVVALQLSILSWKVALSS